MTNLTMNLFYVSGIKNSVGEIFSYKKEYASIIEGGKKGKVFYEGLGFKDITVASCHGTVLIKDSNDRLLAFITPVGHTKANDTKEYRMAYWALKEVERQANAVAEKAAAKASTKVDAEVKKGHEVMTEKKENATIKGSIEVKAPQEKMPWFYAVRNGRSVGIFTDWAEASASVTGYSDARFKKFRALKDAQEFMEGGDDE